MLRYECLVFDHDDTVVRSAETVNYPQFRKVLRELRPGKDLSLADYQLLNADPGFHAMCRDIYGFDDEEMDYMFRDWKEFVKTHIPDPFPGLKSIIQRQKAEGGLICISSHSAEETIIRDWKRNFVVLPDCIYSWELGEKKRKPAPFALRDIMTRYTLCPQQILMIDDLLPGCEMARACQVPFAAAGWSHCVPELAERMRVCSDFYLETVEALEKIVFA